jgi:hypothetical protein
MKNTSTATTATTATTSTANDTLPSVVFESSRWLKTLASDEGQKCESYGIQFRIMTEANFQAAMNRAAAHGRDGGMPPQEW